jgi:hypothetical protein
MHHKVGWLVLNAYAMWAEWAAARDRRRGTAPTGAAPPAPRSHPARSGRLAAPLGAWTVADFHGHSGRYCGEHRTTGGRAWCFDCSEWCYPRAGCVRCREPRLEAVADAAMAVAQWAADGTHLRVPTVAATRRLREALDRLEDDPSAARTPSTAGPGKGLSSACAELTGPTKQNASAITGCHPAEAS